MEWTERELREQTAWMRRVARALTGDSDLADDLTQDAWVATLDGRARMRSPRSWFRRVLQNRRVDDLRTRGRRADRERIAAKPEAIPAVDDAAQRVELQAKLAHVVFSLEEPYRQVITLRYLQGWTPRRIAADLGLERRQVEVRLRKGLERLRSQLDAECRGRREEWFGGLIAIGASGSQLGKVGGLAGACLLALGSAAFLPKLWSHSPAPRAPESSSAALSVPAVQTKSSSSRQLARSAPDPRVSQQTADAMYRVTLVRAEDNEALSGAAVTFEQETLHTDADGLLIIERPAKMGALKLRIAATETTRATRSELLEPGTHTITVPRRGGTLRGQVLTLEGEPVPLAEVRCFVAPGSGDAVYWAEPVRAVDADGQGVFEMHDLAGPKGQARSYRILASTSERMSVYALDGRVKDGANGPALIVTEPALLAFGRVSAVDQASVADAPMMAYSKNRKSFDRARELLEDRETAENERSWGKPRRFPSFKFASEQDGTFQFYRTDAPCHLQVDHAEYRSWREWIPKLERVDVVLDSGCTVAGRVLASDGSPVPGAMVRLSSNEKRKPLATNADGEYEFRALTPLDGALLSVTAERHALAVLAIDILPGGPIYDVRLEKERTVRGRLVDANGEPVTRQQVELRGDRLVGSSWFPRHRGATWEQWANMASWIGWTDYDGEFEFHGLYPGSFRIRAGDETWSVVPEEGEDFVVVRGSHEGSVSLRGPLRSEAGVPFRYCTVSAQRFIEGETVPTSERRVVNFVSGEFEIHALDPGIWQIEISHAQSQSSWSSEPAHFGPGEHLIDAVLAPTQTGPNR